MEKPHVVCNFVSGPVSLSICCLLFKSSDWRNESSSSQEKSVGPAEARHRQAYLYCATRCVQNISPSLHLRIPLPSIAPAPEPFCLGSLARSSWPLN